jgi:hypothetical protein
MAETTNEIGGSYVSLAGRKSDKGLINDSTAGAIAATTTSQVPANDDRVWLLIQNTGTEDIIVGFGADAGAGQTIRPNGVIQVDKDLPWCGIVSIYSLAGSNVAISETYLR